MGYSVATPMRDEAAKARMLKFLDKNLRRYPELLGKPKDEPCFYSGPLHDGLPKDERLAYDHGPCRIGFDFNCHGFERDYIFTVCRWMALQAGKAREYPDKHHPGLQGTFNVIVYDGEEYEDPKEGEGPWPVIPRGTKVPEDKKWCLVDEFGVPSHLSKIRKKERELNEEMYGYDGIKIIRKEMRRLTALWELESK